MAYFCIVVVGALAGFVLWLRERSENRWQKRLDDLLNRKMAEDFYNYVQGSAQLEQIQKMTPEQLRFAEIEKMEKQIAEGLNKSPVPPFINQYRPTIDAQIER